MSLVETQVEYDRKHAAWAVETSRSTVDRWVWSGALRPSLRRSEGSGYGPHLFSVDDVRLAAMLNQYMVPGSALGARIRGLLSEAWYGDGPCGYVVVCGLTVTRCDSVEHAVSVAGAARGVATILWPDRLLGWA